VAAFRRQPEHRAAEHLAQHYFAGRDPIGQFINIRMSNREQTDIIGVVKGAKNVSLRGVPRDEVYEPLPEGLWSTVVARPKDGVPLDGLMSLMRSAFTEQLPNLMVQTAPLEDVVQRSLRRDRLVARLSVAFAALGVVLAVIGLYAAIAQTVSSRTREIGIRIAIGAGRRDVVWMVLKQAIAVTAAGVLIGLPLAIAGSNLTRSLLFEVSPTDPLTLGTSVALLVMTGLAAGTWPARRAAKLDPSQALRFE
jgi:putative ABC transport system permease protein